MSDHADNRCNRFVIFTIELRSGVALDVLAPHGELKPHLNFCRLGLRVREFGNERRLIAALSPRLSDVRCDRTGRPRRIWSVSEYISSFGNAFVSANTSIASSNVRRYTSRSLCVLIRAKRKPPICSPTHPGTHSSTHHTRNRFVRSPYASMRRSRRNGQCVRLNSTFARSHSTTIASGLSMLARFTTCPFGCAMNDCPQN